jgi:hypothetical protein
MNPITEMNNLLKSYLNPIDTLQKSEAMRDTYGFVSSRTILDTFAAHGWNQVSTKISKVNKLDKSGYQKHLVTLENDKYTSINGLSDNNASRPQLVLLNSHDGTTSLRLFWGLLRYACLNGIIAGDSISSFKLTHSQHITKRVPEAIEYMLSNFDTFQNRINTLQALSFTKNNLNQFVHDVYNERLKHVGKLINVDYSLPYLKREQDTSLDAYTVFNRVQEVLIRGGIQYTAERNRLDANGNIINKYIVNTKTRKLNAVSQTINLNKLVFDKAIEYAN